MRAYTLHGSSKAQVRFHDLPGDMSAIVFIHGLGCSSSSDYPEVVSLNELSSHRRILIDLLGSGYSDKPDDFSYTVEDHAKYLKELTETLGLKKFFIFGHSMGGAIAISLCDLCTDKVAGIILSESNLDSGGGFISKRIAEYSEEEYINKGYRCMLEENREESNERWAASASISSPKAMYRESISLVIGTKPTWRERLYSFKIRKTYIFGEKSLPDPDMKELQNNHIHIEVVKDAGHAMAWENPNGLAIAIRNGINLTTAST